jgi:hypothetical protein
MNKGCQTVETATEYSAADPSPRWRELISLYRKMHNDGDGIRPAEKMFAGMPRAKLIIRLRELTRQHGARSLLDYGSGKGMQWRMDFDLGPIGKTAEKRLIRYLELDEIQCYDPGYQPLFKLPERDFDGVICLDVLEHCPEEDMAWVIDQIFGYARKFVLANIACYPAEKHLPNGENAHCTVKPVGWWRDMLAQITINHPRVRYQIICEQLDSDGQQTEEILLEG